MRTFNAIGMVVRLAFAVAAHLEAEILLVDEVLAVGDATVALQNVTEVVDPLSYIPVP